MRELVRCAGFVLAVLGAVVAVLVLRERVATRAAELPTLGLSVAFWAAVTLAAVGMAVGVLTRRSVAQDGAEGVSR